MAALYQYPICLRIHQLTRNTANILHTVRGVSCGQFSVSRYFSRQGLLGARQGVNYSFQAGPWGTLRINTNKIENIVITPLNAQKYPLQNIVFIDFFDAQGGKLENEVIEKCVKSCKENDVVVIENVDDNVMNERNAVISSCNIQLPLKIGRLGLLCFGCKSLANFNGKYTMYP